MRTDGRLIVEGVDYDQTGHAHDDDSKWLGKG